MSTWVEEPPLSGQHSVLLAGGTFVQLTWRHKCISLGIAIFRANITLSQISHPQVKVYINSFIIKIWLLFQNIKIWYCFISPSVLTIL